MTTQNNGSMTALEAGLEAVLFAAGDAVTIERLSAALEAAPAELLDAAAALANRYDFENRGIMLLRIEDKLQLASRPMYGPYVRRVTGARRPRALAPAALEVLTIIAYRQPVTRAFIDQLRGVDSSNTVSSLAEKGLVCADSFVPVRQWQNREKVKKATARQRVNARVMALSAGRWDIVRPLKAESME